MRKINKKKINEKYIINLKSENNISFFKNINKSE